MAQLTLNQVMSMQRDGRRLQIQAQHGPADSTVDRKDSPCKLDHSSHGGETQYPWPYLPEDIWCHVYSLLPMRDAAQAACVSHAFQRSWRCHPNLAFSTEALGIDTRSGGLDEIARNFTSKVDHILTNHSCIAIKTLEIVFHHYNMKRMQLKKCNEIIRLKIPFHLQQLRYLEVFDCTLLQVIEREAPNLSNFQFRGHRQVQLSLGVSLQLKKPVMPFSGVVSYARADLLSSSRYVEGLSLRSCHEMIDTPVLPNKFLHLKHLNLDLSIRALSPTYDYCSLISLFDAFPSLETLIMNVSQIKMLHESIMGDTSHLRQMPGHCHDSLKTVKIIGFSSAKSLVELTCHIIENTTSLECITLDTTRGYTWCSCSSNSTGKCVLLGDLMVEACKGLLAIRTYVEPKVPSGVKINVVEPCRRCHDQSMFLY